MAQLYVMVRRLLNETECECLGPGASVPPPPQRQPTTDAVYVCFWWVDVPFIPSHTRDNRQQILGKCMFASGEQAYVYPSLPYRCNM